MTDPSYGNALAVVTVTYSPGATLARFLETLTGATTRPVHVVLADNGSTDGAPESAERDWENVELVRTGGNLGYGGGANRGVAALGEDYGWIVVCNPDLEWNPGSLDALLDAAKRWPRGGSFGPLIKERTGEVYPSAREVPSLGKGIGHGLLGRVWPANPWTREYKQTETDIREREAGWLSGSCLLLRREAWDSVDGFDSRYFMYFEDVDLGERLARAGWQNVYVPDAEVMHIQGHATARASSRMLAVHHESAYRFIADRHRGPFWAPVRAAVKAGLALRLKAQDRA